MAVMASSRRKTLRKPFPPVDDAEDEARSNPRAECAIYRECRLLSETGQVWPSGTRLLFPKALYRVLERGGTRDTLRHMLGLNERFLSI